MLPSGLAVRVALGLAVAFVASVVGAAPVTDALARPALMLRDPAHGVLLAAARAGSRIVAVGERGLVVLSDDEGRRWRQAPAPTSTTLTALRFADPKHGWAVGHGGVVLATDDGGEHWSRRLDGRELAQIALASAREGGDPRAVRDAERNLADGPDKPLLDLLLLGDQRLLVVGAYGIAAASEDGGRTWDSWMARLPNPGGLHLYAASRRGESLLLAGEQGLVLLSEDGGRSFRRLETPYRGSYFAAAILDHREIVLAGLRGNVLRSIDGGASWSRVATPMPASVTAMTIDGAGRLLAVNQAGFVLTLQGQQLLPLNRQPLPPLVDLLPDVDGGLLTLSVHGVIPLPAMPESTK